LRRCRKRTSLKPCGQIRQKQLQEKGAPSSIRLVAIIALEWLRFGMLLGHMVRFSTHIKRTIIVKLTVRSCRCKYSLREYRCSTPLLRQTSHMNAPDFLEPLAEPSRSSKPKIVSKPDIIDVSWQSDLAPCLAALMPCKYLFIPVR
jgi:hypothetical protein